MIEPAVNLIPIRSRPPFQVPFWQRCIGLVASPFIRKRIENNRPNRMMRMQEILALAHAFQSHDELEAVMGAPKYALDGNLYSRIPTESGNLKQPEIVEVYERNNYGIELLFNNGRMIGMLGIPMPTSWEIASDALPGSMITRRWR